jgi:hypothetical protein
MAKRPVVMMWQWLFSIVMVVLKPGDNGNVMTGDGETIVRAA